MDSYLVDKEVLGEFVDAFINEKFPGQESAVSAGVREDAIRALDHQIMKAILGQLTKEQGAELAHLLEKEDSDESTFAEFFEKNHINLEETIQAAVQNFKDVFVKGGQNA